MSSKRNWTPRCKGQKALLQMFQDGVFDKDSRAADEYESNLSSFGTYKVEDFVKNFDALQKVMSPGTMSDINFILHLNYIP